LPKIWGRAYSILEQIWDKTILIIKRVKTENWWRWGSISLCDAQVWDKFNWVGPAGHFVLKEEDNNKLFLWTGTGLVPLYNQIVAWLERWDKSEYTLLFWIRKQEDIFYWENFEKLSKKYPNFKYIIYLSREEVEWTTKWYITDFLNKQNLQNINETYICWAPAMVDSSIEKLEKNWINKEDIYFEKY
jgi:NAD(P)H-flavin reductase